MCIIAIKKKGVKFPSVERVRTMCANNPDGFCLVTQTGKDAPRVFRTMDVNVFLQYYEAVQSAKSADDTSMFLHARIKTHGSCGIKNCHGWTSEDIVFAHNGVLSIRNRGDMTDSETFFRDIFTPIYKMGGWRAAERAIKAIIGTSRFVFMTKSGGIKHYGVYKNVDGVLYSNESYLTPVERYGRIQRGRSSFNGYIPYGYEAYERIYNEFDLDDTDE